MNLNEALSVIAKQCDLDILALEVWAAEDEYTGWDKGEGDFPTGSIWTVEGQVLYALVRALRPTNVMEFGTGSGCSATHIAAALARNRKGKLTSFDRSTGMGAWLPEKLRKKVKMKSGDISVFLDECDEEFDFIFEDVHLAPEDAASIMSWARDHLTPGGILVSHDAMHHLAGENVREGYRRAGIDAKFYLIEPSDCGLAVWRKPKATPGPGLEEDRDMATHTEDEPEIIRGRPIEDGDITWTIPPADEPE